MSPRRKPASRPAPRPIDGMRLGWVAGVHAERGLLVDYPDNPHGAVPARSIVPLDARALEAAVKQRQGAVLSFEDGDPRRPVLMGLVQPTTATPMVDALLAAPARAAPERDPTIEGKRVVLEGEDGIVLGVGDAKIILRRNGVVIVRGQEVESKSSGRNVIRGRKVAFN